jgi:hypothetical protein
MPKRDTVLAALGASVRRWRETRALTQGWWPSAKTSRRRPASIPCPSPIGWERDQG